MTRLSCVSPRCQRTGHCHQCLRLPVRVGDGAGYSLGLGRHGVRVWRLGEGTPVGQPLNLPVSTRAVAIYGNVIVTASGPDIAVHQPALPEPMR